MTPYRRPDDSAARLFVQACKRAGSRNLIDELLDPFRLLAAAGKAPPDVAAAVRLFRPRPWYSAQELAFMWPAICLGIAGKQVGRKPDAATLSKRLVQYRLPRLKDWNGEYLYVWQGVAREYFLVQDVNRWRRLRVSQTEFEERMDG